MVVHAEHGNEWVRADFSQKKIPVKSAIIVSVEWISGFGNNEKNWHRKDDEMPTYYFAGCSDYYFNGMVLGLTWNYGIQSICFSTNKYYPNEWRYNASLGAKGHGMIRIKHWINPMIYCTYNYYEK